MTTEEMKFEEAMQKLEQVVQQLESGDVPLEDAIQMYQEGMSLAAACQGKLQHAEKQLMAVIDQDGNISHTDFSKGEQQDAE